MKYLCSSIALLLSLLVFSSNSYGRDEFPALKGLYLGQKPPGLIPEIFAPDIISKSGSSEYGMSFSPALDEMYFTIQKKQF